MFSLEGFLVKDVNETLQWIVSALYGGYIASNVLKWHWWRFNATGFFWGMLTGIIVAMIFSLLIPSGELLNWFPVLFGLSLAGSIGGSYLSPPTDEAVLKSFYKNVRPWGFWGPVKRAVLAGDPSFQSNKNFKLNMFNVVIGDHCANAASLFCLCTWCYHNCMPLLYTVGILAVAIIILKKTWWDKLKDY